MSPAFRSILTALVLLPLAIQAQVLLQPGEFQPHVEDGRTELHFADEVLPLFDAMMVRAASAGFQQLGDATMLKLATDAAAANFYFPGSRVAAHSEIFEELARRQVASELETDDYHRTLVAARLWEEAAAIARRFPDFAVEALPEHFDTGNDAGGLKVWDFDAATRTLRRRELGIEKGLVLVVISHPNCGFSRAAMLALETNSALAAELPAHRYFVAPTFGGLRLESILAWNTAHPGSPHVLVDRPMAWPFVRSWNTPQFFFLVDGQLVEYLEGWPDASQAVALVDASRRAQALADLAH